MNFNKIVSWITEIVGGLLLIVGIIGLFFWFKGPTQSFLQWSIIFGVIGLILLNPLSRFRIHNLNNLTWNIKHNIWIQVGIVLVILFLIINSGILNGVGLTNKYKIQSNVLCAEFDSLNGSSIIQEFGGADALIVQDCINACGSKSNYSGYGCDGKFMACYCENPV